MISKGQILENPVTGEVLRFIETAASTGGEKVVVETTVRPGGFVAAAHVHPHQTETFTVREGLVAFEAGGRSVVAGPGESLVIEPGTPHKFRNAGEGDAVFVCEVRPALAFESLIETMFSLAADGKTNRKGMPNPLRLAVIAQAHFDVVRLPFPPVALQRLGLALGSPVGRLFGFTPTYESAGAGVPAFAA